MIRFIDQDGDGEIDFFEFSLIMYTLSGYAKEDNHPDIFTYAKGQHLKKLASFKKKSTRENIWATFDDPSSSKLAYIISIVIMALILISCAIFSIETLPTERGKDIYKYIETVCISMFTIEFGFRVSSTPNYKSFASDFLNWVDFIAILPFYIELASPAGSEDGSSSAFLRILRLVRVVRVVKFSRYLTWIKILGSAFRQSIAPLGMVCFVLAIAMVLFSSAIYYFERREYDSHKRLYYADAFNPLQVQYLSLSLLVHLQSARFFAPVLSTVTG